MSRRAGEAAFFPGSVLRVDLQTQTLQLWHFSEKSVFSGSQLSVGTQEAESITEKTKLGRNVRETETSCPKGLYLGGKFCCQPCQPGERKHLDCTVSGGKPSCLPCTEGKEYMDKEHYSDKCRRCALCDEGHGLEVETNCTLTQNTKCRCKHNFYCNASVCEHCDPCTVCEHGTLEECTRTSNTKCKQESSRHHFLWLFIIPVWVIVFVLIYKKYWKRRPNDPESGISNSENMPMISSDVDLSKYILAIAELMELDKVKKFVRKNGISETKIDEIKNDYFQNTAEQKIQMLQWWYQSHGKKDAYHTLIKSLKKINCCALAERIQDIVMKDIKNSTSDNRNENESENYLSSS
ncbi:tumor necrosis factor receptor superfamily member 6 isoform X2 [Cricetulus griseus]|uniref:Tumor necrosis factor receptor superfamily member 6 n=1 Tax=Cricetulus griseus TaxID=10029 RepID=A0A9J7JK47_CRIGR|nr:tumor necrosis factor receptor superfamily member 6 isoform X2 [Cricetulus griseus]XP_027262186.1 tumor necrosis factor receptor superfamily member 6 isoform X2 [Cricetulus griseus]